MITKWLGGKVSSHVAVSHIAVSHVAVSHVAVSHVAVSHITTVFHFADCCADGTCDTSVVQHRSRDGSSQLELDQLDRCSAGRQLVILVL